MTLKDGHDVAGLRTTVGTVQLDQMADQDGTVAARLRAAGAIIIGHTNVPPWLADYQSANPIFGRTANPWDTERTAGGSSGGAAAALAASMTPLEIGSGPGRFAAAAGALLRGLRPQDNRAPRPAHRVLSASGRSPAVGPHHVLPQSHGARPRRPAARPGHHRRPGRAGRR